MGLLHKHILKYAYYLITGNHERSKEYEVVRCKSSHEFTNKHGITCEISIDITNGPVVGLGIKLAGEGLNIVELKKILAVDSNDLYNHFDEILRGLIGTSSLTDVTPKEIVRQKKD
ncbi:MAG TPA: hypothetical protein VHB48_06280 [Chitinophagaceae bacterium]|nr:hypothetical protein [Chitinophagaceae bacterium]